MIIPSIDLWACCTKLSEAGIEVVIPMVSTKLLERLSHLLFLECDNVGPEFSIPELFLSTKGTISVNDIATVKEEVGRGLLNFREYPIAADVRVYAVALTTKIPRPCK